jgi:L-alanine-DL-glutamate epimerase-like enolase superfamily enzyme
MQITNVKVTPVQLSLRQAVRMASSADIDQVTAIFVRIETRQGRTAWGCAIAHPELSGEEPESAIKACRACADRARDLHPINIEYSLAELAPIAGESKAARCAYDLAFSDLLGLAADMPLYRLLGGYRNRIQTSATIPLVPVQETVEIAKARASLGFRMLKIKGGLDPDGDVQRVRAVHRALPDHVLRLDADGGYQVQDALDVARALEGRLEMLEQPTAPDNLDSLSRVTQNSPVPILADQSVSGTASALDFAFGHYADGISVKIATCGGLGCARQIDAISRAAGMAMMVGCLIEPALLISAGLSFALSSPNVRYGDLDGDLDLADDPTLAGFELIEGWLVARDVPGLGCTVDLG